MPTHITYRRVAASLNDTEQMVINALTGVLVVPYQCYPMAMPAMALKFAIQESQTPGITYRDIIRRNGAMNTALSGFSVTGFWKIGLGKMALNAGMFALYGGLKKGLQSHGFSKEASEWIGLGASGLYSLLVFRPREVQFQASNICPKTPFRSLPAFSEGTAKGYLNLFYKSGGSLALGRDLLYNGAALLIGDKFTELALQLSAQQLGRELTKNEKSMIELQAAMILGFGVGVATGPIDNMLSILAESVIKTGNKELGKAAIKASIARCKESFIEFLKTGEKAAFNSLKKEFKQIGSGSLARGIAIMGYIIGIRLNKEDIQTGLTAGYTVDKDTSYQGLYESNREFQKAVKTLGFLSMLGITNRLIMHYSHKWSGHYANTGELPPQTMARNALKIVKQRWSPPPVPTHPPKPHHKHQSIPPSTAPQNPTQAPEKMQAHGVHTQPNHQAPKSLFGRHGQAVQTALKTLQQIGRRAPK